MARFQYLNVEPSGKKKSDCVTRAIKLASGLPYATIRKKLFHTKKLLNCESSYCPTCYSFLIQEVLGGVPKNCEGMTVGEFADLHPEGTYLIRIQGHLLCILDNTIMDLWDNRNRFCDLAWEVR
jgi:hypothetical protein